MYLLDTNVLSDSLRLRQYPKLANWLSKQNANELYISSISLAEISYGVNRLTEGKRKKELQADLLRLQQRFANNILPVDANIALIYGKHQAEQVNQGFNDHPFDSLLIATAKEHKLAVVTRNLKHYKNRGIVVIKPYG